MSHWRHKAGSKGQAWCFPNQLGRGAHPDIGPPNPRILLRCAQARHVCAVVGRARACSLGGSPYCRSASRSRTCANVPGVFRTVPRQQACAGWTGASTGSLRSSRLKGWTTMSAVHPRFLVEDPGTRRRLRDAVRHGDESLARPIRQMAVTCRPFAARRLPRDAIREIDDLDRRTGMARSFSSGAPIQALAPRRRPASGQLTESASDLFRSPVKAHR